MLIVLDTNLIVSDPALSSGPSAILLDYARRTESRILLSALVLDEIIAQRMRTLEARWDAYVRASGLVRSFVLDLPPSPAKPEFEAIARTHLADLRKRLRVFDRDIIPVTESHLREAVQRAVRRTPPCTDRGEEIRDAIIWLQVLQLVRASVGTPVAFISANSHQFGTKEGTLLPALATEVGSGKLVYYTSLDAFAKQHATPIEFITTKWIEERISADEVYAAAEGRLQQIAERTTWFSSAFAVAEIESHWIDLNDFYVYEMEDGTLRVVAIWDGTIECRVEDSDYDYGFNPLIGRHEYHYTPIDSGLRSREVQFVVTTEAIVRGRELKSWQVIEVDRA